jgi:Helix-turn-helix domain
VLVEISRGERMSNRYLDLVKGARPFGHASRRTVMLILADHANAQGRCWPSVRRLELETELSKRTLLRCLSDLENEGWIAIERKSFGPHLNGNQYVLNSKKLVAYQRTSTGAMVSPVEHSEDATGVTVTPTESADKNSSEARIVGAMVSPAKQVVGATVTSAGVMVAPLQVPKATVTGAKTASLYRRTPKNPHRNPQGGTDDENETPPSIRSQSESFEESQSGCAKVFFDRIGVPDTEQTIALAAKVIGILAKESGTSPWDGMLELESVAKEGQARGEVINKFWLEDSKWRKIARSRPPATDRRAMVGMYRPEMEGANPV